MIGRKMSRMLQIHHLLKQVPLTRRALRVYEEQGLLLPAGRDKLGHRMFSPSALPRLRLIRDLRGAGLALAAIRDVLDARVVRKDDKNADTWLDRLTNVLCRHTEELREQLEVVKKAEREMRDAVVWLRTHKDQVLGSPKQALLAKDIPFIAQALLSQPSEHSRAAQAKAAPGDPLFDEDEDDPVALAY